MVVKGRMRNKFETLRDLLKRDIVRGRYRAGVYLPNEEALTATYGVNQGTVNKAIASLATEGFVVTKSRLGSMVLETKDRKIAARLVVVAMAGSGHLYGELSAQLMAEIQRHHYFPTLINVADTNDRDLVDNYVIPQLHEAINAFPEFLVVDGVADFPFHILKERRSEIANLIIINRYESDLCLDAHYILSDYQRGAYLAASHLIGQGCRKLLMVLHEGRVKHEYDLSAMMVKGVGKACAEHGMPFGASELLASDSEELKSRFTAGERPLGILAASDYLARSAQERLDGLGLKCAVDYKIAGYFNTPWASEIRPRLTSVSLREAAIIEELGRIIVQKPEERQRIIIEPELITREST